MSFSGLKVQTSFAMMAGDLRPAFTYQQEECDCFDQSDDSSDDEGGGIVMVKTNSSALLKKFHDDFLWGAKTTHDNFLDHWYCWFARPGLYLFIGVFGPLSPVSQQLVPMVEQFARVTAATPLFRLLDPIYIVFLDMFADLVSPALHKLLSPRGEAGRELFGRILGALLDTYLVLYLAPIFEELKYRGPLCLFHNAIAKAKDQNEDAQAEGREEPIFFIWRKLCVANSLLFGLMHLPKSLSLAREDCTGRSGKWEACWALFGCTLGCVSPYLFSDKVLIPALEQRGLAAAMGAHMAWNWNVTFLIPSVTIRMINRGAKWWQKHQQSKGDESETKEQCLYITLKKSLWVPIATCLGTTCFLLFVP